MNKIDKPLARLIKKKGRRIKSTKKFNLPRLKKEEIETMNKSFIGTEIKTVIKKKKGRKTEAQAQITSKLNSIRYLEN